MLSETKRTSSQKKYSSKSNATGATSKVVPHKKRGGADAKRLKFHSNTCADAESSEHSLFQKLDPSKPDQKRRLEQRRKMISYGKNTAGYEEYLKQVPTEKRRKRNMETPMTPDYTLDIPNKRWMGQVRAWRRALHNYDPPDLQKSLASVAEPMDARNEGGQENGAGSTLQDRELAAAKEKGLLVEFDDAGHTGMDKESPTSVVGVVQTQQQEMNELDRLESARGNGMFCSDAEDSDDDLL